LGGAYHWPGQLFRVFVFFFAGRQWERSLLNFVEWPSVGLVLHGWPLALVSGGRGGIAEPAYKGRDSHEPFGFLLVDRPLADMAYAMRYEKCPRTKDGLLFAGHSFRSHWGGRVGYRWLIQFAASRRFADLEDRMFAAAGPRLVLDNRLTKAFRRGEIWAIQTIGMQYFIGGILNLC